VEDHRWRATGGASHPGQGLKRKGKNHAGTAHDKVEKNLGLLLVLTFLVILVGALVEIVPLFFQKSTTEPVAGLKPYSALQLEGRDVYIREGCYVCHSQMIRPFRAETERYGHYSVPASSCTTGRSSGQQAHRPGPAARRRALLG